MNATLTRRSSTGFHTALSLLCGPPGRSASRRDYSSNSAHRIKNSQPLEKGPAFNSESSSHDSIRDDLRSILRKSAQPVTVMTTVLPAGESSTSQEPTTFHGATLSSFTSVSMHPLPLVAFALRVPSRLATSLKARLHRSSSSQSPSPPHMIINILNSTQSSLAIRFSRPDLFPHPFASPTSQPGSSSTSSTSLHPDFHLSPTGLPIITGSLGALSCEVVKVISLDHREWSGLNVDAEMEGPSSELFLARVTQIECTQSPDTDPKRDELVQSDGLPLVYHQRHYRTIIPADPVPIS